jgi:hypothetical protein
MGLIRNFLIKTAIKKALKDLTKDIEDFGNNLQSIASFGKMVMGYAEFHPNGDKDLIEDTWEATFFGLVSKRAAGEAPSIYLVENQNELNTLVSLITQWISLRGGDLTNIYKEIAKITPLIKKPD